MTISQRGIDFIKQWEGFRSTMYLDIASLPTIGYGTLIDTKEEQWLMTAVIDEPTAERLLRTDVRPIEVFVSQVVSKLINQNQYDALCSFVYNLGRTALRKSTLLKMINTDPNDVWITHEFEKWCYADGKRSEGLLKRRKAEAELYFS